MKYVEVNLNKLYSPKKPNLTDMWEYYEKVRNQLTGLNLSELNIVITGTAPLWLFAKIMLLVEPFVSSVNIIDNITGDMIEISSESIKIK